LSGVLNVAYDDCGENTSFGVLNTIKRWYDWQDFFNPVHSKILKIVFKNGISSFHFQSFLNLSIMLSKIFCGRASCSALCCRCSATRLPKSVPEA
jgi:hypothetical protein